MKDFCIALFKKEQEEKAYRRYMADSIRNISENTAKVVVILSQGKADASYIGVSYGDIIGDGAAQRKTVGGAGRILEKLRGGDND